MLSKDKVQISVTLPKAVVKLLDEQAKSQLRTRSMEVAKIIMDYFKEQKEKQI